MKKIIACVHYLSMEHDAHQCARSWNYFHPDLPMVIIDNKFAMDTYHKYGAGFPYAPIIKPLLDECEMLIHLDADCIVTSRVEEILAGDFDVCSTKNNNYLGMAGSVNPGYQLPGIPIDKYINIGTFALKGDAGKEFLKDWMELNALPSSANVPHFENGTFNMIFYNGKYKTKLLDEDSNDVYYGLSSAWGYGGNHWQSWKQIYLDGQDLRLRHKLIRILHKAGAGSPDNRFPDLDALFSPEVANRLREIIA